MFDDLNFADPRKAPSVAVDTQCITAENRLRIITNIIQLGIDSPYVTKYKKFSVIPNPRPIAPPYTIPSVILSNFLFVIVINKNNPLVISSTIGATTIDPNLLNWISSLIKSEAINVRQKTTY